MIEPKQDPQTATQTQEGLSTSPRRQGRSNIVWIINALIILAALVFIFFLWPNKPDWLNASPLLYKIQSPPTLVETPAAISLAETSPAATVETVFQATITPAPTLGVATATPLKTITAAPTSQPPSAKVTPSVSSGQYKPQEGSPFYISAKAFQGAEQGCNWIGIAGQAFDADNSPRNNLVVVVDGKLGDKDINLTTNTGTAILYGPAGYEITIALKPQDSEDSLTIQLFSELGQPLSEKVSFATHAACEKNLAIVNFVEMK